MEKLTQALNKEERGLFWADRDIWLRGTLAYAAWRGADLGAEWAKADSRLPPDALTGQRSLNALGDGRSRDPSGAAASAQKRSPREAVL